MGFEDRLFSGDFVLASVRVADEWGFYVAPIDVWVMDWVAWRQGFVEAGYAVSRDAGGRRGGIDILDESSVRRVLAVTERVEEGRLRDALRCRMPMHDWWSVASLFPVVLLDFAARRLASIYSETLALERYVPKGWVGEFAEFFDDIPLEHRYWIDGGSDYLRAALAVGK